MPDSDHSSDKISLTAEIVSAFVGNNSLQRSEISGLIESVHHALVQMASGKIAATAPETLMPAVSIKKSVTDDFIICLEDGKKFKSLKRHLTMLGLSPEEYREKWKLPSDYRMVAKNYSAKRSALATSHGLGQKGKKSRKPRTKKATTSKSEAA
jgi:predicted transcriptional regulator